MDMILFEKIIPAFNGRKKTLHRKTALRRQGERLGRISFFQCVKNIHEKNRDVNLYGRYFSVKENDGERAIHHPKECP